jgi:hypothetical protein
MSKDVKLIAEAYKKVLEGYIDPYELMNNLVGAITAGSTMFGGATSPEADSLIARTISKITHSIENGNLDKKMLLKTLIRARRENGRAFTSLVNFGEKGSYEGKETFLKHVLPIAKKILIADVNELREMEAAEEAKDYLLKKVDQS